MVKIPLITPATSEFGFKAESWTAESFLKNDAVTKAKAQREAPPFLTSPFPPVKKFFLGTGANGRGTIGGISKSLS